LAVHAEYLEFMNEQRKAAGGKDLDIPPEYVAYMQERRYKENLKLSMIPEQQAAVEANGGQYRWGSGEVKITSITACGPDGVGKRLFEVGTDVYFKVHYHVEKPIKDAVFGIGFFRNSGENLYGTNTRIDGHPNFDLDEDGEFTIIMRKIPLMPDQYTVSFSIEYGDGVPVDYWKDALKIDTYRQTPDVGGFFMEHDWDYNAKGQDNG
jgi:ABC-2 type transport system ATP-binding protein